MSETQSVDGQLLEKIHMLQFLKLVGKLKHLKRTGWVMRAVHDPETVSGHMYRMGMMTFLLEGKDDLDTSRCMKLALVHDLAECVVGDITPQCGVDKGVKHAMEMAAMKNICLLAGPAGNEIFTLFEEYEAQETKEAKTVKELDVFDMILQAYEYESSEHAPGRLQEFFDSTAHRTYANPVIAELVACLHHERAEEGGAKQEAYPASGATESAEQGGAGQDRSASGLTEVAEQGGAGQDGTASGLTEPAEEAVPEDAALELAEEALPEASLVPLL